MLDDMMHATLDNKIPEMDSMDAKPIAEDNANRLQQLTKQDDEIKKLKAKIKQLEKKVVLTEDYATWHKQQYQKQCQHNVDLLVHFQKILDTVDKSLPDHLKTLGVV